MRMVDKVALGLVYLSLTQQLHPAFTSKGP
jgi:hypothetical protein